MVVGGEQRARRAHDVDDGFNTGSCGVQRRREVGCKAPTSGRGEGAVEEAGGELVPLSFGVGWRSGGRRRPVRTGVGAACELC